MRQEQERSGNGLMSQPSGGYDALKRDYTDDMFRSGIIDPVKVARGGLQHAVSTVGMFLTTEAVITDKPEPEKPDMPAPGMGGMY